MISESSAVHNMEQVNHTDEILTLERNTSSSDFELQSRISESSAVYNMEQVNNTDEILTLERGITTPATVKKNASFNFFLLYKIIECGLLILLIIITFATLLKQEQNATAEVKNDGSEDFRKIHEFLLKMDNLKIELSNIEELIETVHDNILFWGNDVKSECYALTRFYKNELVLYMNETQNILTKNLQENFIMLYHNLRQGINNP